MLSVNKFSQKMQVYFLKEKSDALGVFKKFKAAPGKESGRWARTL